MANSSPSNTLSDISTTEVEVAVRVRPIESSLQRISVANFAFQLVLTFYCIAQCIISSELSYISMFNTIAKLLSYYAIGFLVIKILLFSKYSILEITIYLILCTIAILCSYNYGETELIYLVLFITGARDIEARLICKTALPVIAICCILIILLSLMGVIGNRAAYNTSVF